MAQFKEECQTCCCGHDHDPDCEWYQQALLKHGLEFVELV